MLSADRLSIYRALRLASAALPAGCVVAVCDVTGTQIETESQPNSIDANTRALLEQEASRVMTTGPSERHVNGLVATVPLRAPGGNVVGVLVATCADQHTFASTELSLLNDVAHTLEAEIRMRAIADAYAEQLAAEQLEEKFASSLAAVAAATNRSLTPSDVVQAVTRHGETAVGASLISLAMVEGTRLRFEHGEGVPEVVARTWITAKITAPLPMCVAARAGEPVVLANRAAFRSWPDFEKAVQGLDLGSFIALPIADRTGGALAVIGVGFRNELAVDEVPLSVRRLTAVTGQALQRASAHEVAHDHASVLESIVLPAVLPIAPELELSGAYLPPLVGQRVGGDLYDAWVRDDGTTAVLVADVAGHTLRSARTTTRLRHSIGMLALEMRPPDEILQSVNRYVQNSSETHLATCCLCVFDPNQGVVSIANAGHPQPRLRRAGGSIEAIGPQAETLLGYGEVTYTCSQHRFDPGDTLVLFTDGLVERRGTDLRVGHEWLDEQLVATSNMSAAETSAYLLTDLDPVREDDVVVMVVQRTMRAEISGRSISWSWPAGELSMSDARGRLRDWFSTTPDLERVVDIDSLVLVATELLTNAREAADVSNGEILLGCQAHPARLDLRVTNSGDHFNFRPSMPGPESLRGRGLAISAALANLSVEDFASNSVTIHASFDRSQKAQAQT